MIESSLYSWKDVFDKCFREKICTMRMQYNIMTWRAAKKFIF